MKRHGCYRPTGLLVLMTALTAVISTAAGEEERLPIISRMQVLYSMVGHHSSISDRVSFYNSKGGNQYYVVPNLVYEPSVTLYNPYNTELQIPQSRVRIENPPVGFKFKKINDYLRSEWASGDTFYGLGRFNIVNQSSTVTQKSLTLTLGGGDASDYAGDITLQPGESRDFQVRVIPSWTWGLETASDYDSVSVFDTNPGWDFTNKDRRTGNPFGAEAIASDGDHRAGFQTDHLSVQNARPISTRYTWEGSFGTYGWVAIHKMHTFRAEAKGLRTSGSNLAVPDFKLLLLRGLTVDPAADTAKSYTFNVADLIQPAGGGVGVPTVERTWIAEDLIQAPNDLTPGGKSPFATFTIAAKASALRQGLFLAETQPTTNQLYEARLDEVTSFNEVSGIGPSDGSAAGMQVSGVERVGDSLMLDVASQPGIPLGRVMGTADPALGFSDDLTSSCVITPGPVGTGLFKVMVPVAGLGERYFVRVER